MATTNTKPKTTAENTAGKEEAAASLARETMTLQQKLVEIRKAVPTITQQQHSDGVKYKFAKIFDVYKLITPAMNTYGVNFDIVAEEPTKHDQLGNAVYYTSYDQQTRNGVRTIWLYEADITIRWTNADNDDDILEVTLHAIGTNDQGPDKAKGSAWTYCLKYYLFEKFSIDQGDDDPDNKDLSGENVKPPQTAQTQRGNQQSQQQQNRPQSSPQASQGGVKRLSDKQLERMYLKGEDAGMAREQVNEAIANKYRKTDPTTLTRQEYDDICAELDRNKIPGGI